MLSNVTKWILQRAYVWVSWDTLSTSRKMKDIYSIYFWLQTWKQTHNGNYDRGPLGYNVVQCCRLSVASPTGIFRVFYSENGVNRFFRNTTIWCHKQDDKSWLLPPQAVISHHTITWLATHNTNLSSWIGALQDPNRPTEMRSLYSYVPTPNNRCIRYNQNFSETSPRRIHPRLFRFGFRPSQSIH